MRLILLLAFFLLACTKQPSPPAPDISQDPNIRELDMILQLDSLSPEQKSSMKALYQETAKKLAVIREKIFQRKGAYLRKTGIITPEEKTALQKKITELTQEELEATFTFMDKTSEILRKSHDEFDYIYRAILREDRRSGSGVLR